MTDISDRSPSGGLNQPTNSANLPQTTTDASTTQKAVDAGSDVMDSVKQQGAQVAGEAGRQARDLYGQARTQVADQASVQQKRAAGGLHSLADEIAKMADGSGGSGPAHHLARQASNKIQSMAAWLDDREPGNVLNEVTAYARRKPGMFLLGAAVLGTVAGRLSKNLMGGPTSTNAPTTGTYRTPAARVAPTATAGQPVDSWSDPHAVDDPQYGRS